MGPFHGLKWKKASTIFYVGWRNGDGMELILANHHQTWKVFFGISFNENLKQASWNSYVIPLWATPASTYQHDRKNKEFFGIMEISWKIIKKTNLAYHNVSHIKILLKCQLFIVFKWCKWHFIVKISKFIHFLSKNSIFSQFLTFRGALTIDLGHWGPWNLLGYLRLVKYTP